MKKIQRYLSWIFILAILASFLALPAAAISDKEKEILQQQKVYTVAYTPDHAPFSYKDDQGNPRGMAIDMMNYIAEEAGIAVEYISLREVRPKVVVDINLSVLDNDQLYSNRMDSHSYFSFIMMLVGKDKQCQYDGAKIGHLNYADIDYDEIAANLPGCVPHRYVSYEAMQSDMMAGKLDYILTSNLVAQHTGILVETTENQMVQTKIDLNVVMKYNENLSHQQVQAFDNLIDSLDEETKYNIMLNAAMVGTVSQLSFGDFLEVHKFEIMVIGIVLVCIIAGILVISSCNKQKVLTQALNVDEITQFSTKRKFVEDASWILQKSKKHDQFYLFTLDMDNFKYINESIGYGIGTQAIVAMSQSIARHFPKARCLARPFADNFLLLLDQKPPRDISAAICNYAMEHGLQEILGSTYKVTTSTGIYEVKDKSLPMSYMIDCANIARRRGKGIYGHTEIYFTQALELEIKSRNDIITSMESALQNQEFKMHYQPKLDFQTKKLVGAEALVRWQRPDGSQVFPNQFIEVFEKNGFIAQLDYYVLDQVCRFIATHGDMPKIAVNLSGYSFLEPDLIDRILEILGRHKVKPESIEIEITESAIVIEFDTIALQIAELRAVGFSVAMDDFGTGLSSLNRLKDISIDVLKIDQAFLGEGDLSEKGVSIMDSIIQMAQKVQVTTVAEGVETGTQVKLLEHLNCDIAQGYYYSRPLSEEKFLSYVKSHQG